MLEQWRRADGVTFGEPKVLPQTFLGVVWTFTALSFLLLPARLYARWSTARRFFWDDAITLFAWTISLAISIFTTVLAPVTYELIYIAGGKVTGPWPNNIRTITLQFARLFNIVPILLYVGLWSIKLAFLLFFRRLGVRSIRNLDRWWWAIFCICLITFTICFTTLPYRCCFTTFEIILSDKCQTQGWSFISLKVNCALDVLTDCLIMTIPFLLLRKVRMPTQKRIIQSGIFSLVVITMIFSIIRVTLTTFGVTTQIDPTWMYMWSSIELNIAIVVACIAPYRSFFLRSRSSIPRDSPQLRIPDQDIKNMSPYADPVTCTRVAPWLNGGVISIPYSSLSGERPRLGILPDDSESWSQIGANSTLPKVEEETSEDAREARDSMEVEEPPQAHVRESADA